MTTPIDIFRVLENGEHLWIEPSETMDDARARVQSLGSGKYLIANQRMGIRVPLYADC